MRRRADAGGAATPGGGTTAHTWSERLPCPNDTYTNGTWPRARAARTNIRRLAGLPGLLMRVREQGWADPTGVVDSGNLPLADERIGREG